MAITEELDTRMHFIESEIDGEKLVTRHVLKQAQHNADDLAEIKTHLRYFRDDLALVKATQAAQGGMLNILVQDVAALRRDTIELRRGQDELRRDVTELRRDVTDLRRGQEELGRDVTELRHGQDAITARLDRMQEETNARFDRLERNVAAILAAVSPRDA